MPRVVLCSIVASLILSTALLSTQAGAVDFTSLECAAVPFQQESVYNVQVPCTAVVRRAGSGMWYNAPAQDCTSFCRAIASENVPSPDGFGCTSGEERPWSAIGRVNYSPTGCWHDCRLPEGRAGAVSVGPRCYAPGQKRDNDRTDITVGCFCATGDIYSDVIDVGIHASGTAQVLGINIWVSGMTAITAATMNDRPGRVSYIRGSIPLAGEAVVHLLLNMKGACGTSIAMSGRTNGSGGTSANSSEIVVALPGCAQAACDTPVEQTGALSGLEEIIRAQRIVVYDLLDPIIKATTDQSIRTKAQELRGLADIIKRDLVRDMNRRYPKSTQRCSNCSTLDLSPIKNDFVMQSRKMARLTRQVAIFARTATAGLVVRGSLQTAEALFARFRLMVGELPGETADCSG